MARLKVDKNRSVSPKDVSIKKCLLTQDTLESVAMVIGISLITANAYYITLFYVLTIQCGMNTYHLPFDR